jgi:hypothetical protein
MELDHSLDNVVVFDIPSLYQAGRLCELLQADRLAWLYEREGNAVVAASLRAEPLDLAELLRAVAAWAGERGLGSIRFELDGRSYVLDAAAALVPHGTA